MPREQVRRVCFVTGTRAEFGLMRRALECIRSNPALELQLIVTGMHLDRRRGRSIDAIRSDGWKIDAVIPWSTGDGTQTSNAVATGKAIASMAAAFSKLKSDIVLVTGDRVEAFAGASAAHLGGRLVAHVHGGDRALGLIDDSLRHAITKLAHIHFPATPLSAKRLEKMGEDRWRIFPVGSPGLDDVLQSAAGRDDLATAFPHITPRRFALLLLHPQSTDPARERLNSKQILQSVQKAGLEQIVIIHPNNDPGSDGIAGEWDGLKESPHLVVWRDLPRTRFLGLLRDAAVLVGNSSSGIIEAASFGTPVLDIGTRQAGREHGPNVIHAPMNQAAITRALGRIWAGGAPLRFKSHNIYGAGKAGPRIATTLSRINTARFLPKLIAF